MKNHKTAVIGSGPAGLTAAIYLARADLHPTVFAGTTFGGQLMLTTEVDNFPGFPEGIQGGELMDRMIQQAKKFGAEILYTDVTKTLLSKDSLTLFADEKEYTFDGLILAPGASARTLGIPSEAKFIGKGVSYCATCDGAFFRNKEIAVIGGGDSAMEEATFLTKFASKVYLIHRKDSFRASKIMQEKAMHNEKITIIYNSEIVTVLGTDKVTGITLRNTVDNTERDMQLDGVFIAIGHIPNTAIIKDQVTLNEQGYIIPMKGSETNIPGVFTAGDVDDAVYQQAITAAGEGCRAALALEKYLEA